jgi:streptomycin 6-kinase
MFCEAFRRKIEREFGDRGVAWLEALPNLITRYAERWSLTVYDPFEGLTYGYLAPALRKDGTPCVLKLTIAEPPSEFAASIDCLRIWKGDGCVRLLETDEADGAVLLERLQPGLC